MSKTWCLRKMTVDASYVASMEEVLDLYGRELPEGEVMVCFDEHSYSMHSHVTPPLPIKASKPARVGVQKRGHMQHLHCFCACTRLAQSCCYEGP